MPWTDLPMGSPTHEGADQLLSGWEATLLTFQGCPDKGMDDRTICQLRRLCWKNWSSLKTANASRRLTWKRDSCQVHVPAQPLLYRTTVVIGIHCQSLVGWQKAQGTLLCQSGGIWPELESTRHFQNMQGNYLGNTVRFLLEVPGQVRQNWSEPKQTQRKCGVTRGHKFYYTLGVSCRNEVLWQEALRHCEWSLGPSLKVFIQVQTTEMYHDVEGNKEGFG